MIYYTQSIKARFDLICQNNLDSLISATNHPLLATTIINSTPITKINFLITTFVCQKKVILLVNQAAHH